jgi:hypothetical protein
MRGSAWSSACSLLGKPVPQTWWRSVERSWMILCLDPGCGDRDTHTHVHTHTHKHTQREMRRKRERERERQTERERAHLVQPLRAISAVIKYEVRLADTGAFATFRVSVVALSLRIFSCPRACELVRGCRQRVRANYPTSSHSLPHPLSHAVCVCMSLRPGNCREHRDSGVACGGCGAIVRK